MKIKLSFLVFLAFILLLLLSGYDAAALLLVFLPLFALAFFGPAILDLLSRRGGRKSVEKKQDPK